VGHLSTPALVGTGGHSLHLTDLLRSGSGSCHPQSEGLEKAIYQRPLELGVFGRKWDSKQGYLSQEGLEDPLERDQGVMYHPMGLKS
jgi:hypothetical protein